MDMNYPRNVGYFVKEDMQYKDVTYSDLVRKLGVSEQQLLLLLEGKIDINQRIAIALAKVFNTSPNFYINVQNAYNNFIGRDIIIQEVYDY